MNRELCEFYRDRGYPQEDADWYSVEQDGYEGIMSGRYARGNPHCDDTDIAWDLKGRDVNMPAIPDIPGLLAFLREKLPDITEILVGFRFGKCKAIIDRPCYQAPLVVADPDPTTALALAGKAALEALDDN